jgi:hypothetical protein
MLIECPHCDARVYGKLIAERAYAPTYESGGYTDAYKYVFLECPSCHESLLGLCNQDEQYDEYTRWESPIRLWPCPEELYDPNIPHFVRTSLDDARKCFHAKVYTACAVMCGRALEAICKEKTGETILAKGLQELKSTNQIDDQLFNWGEALRKERNIGAHASEETVSRLDAQDILDFANAIVEYVYVMTAKFEAYKARKADKAEHTQRHA